MACPNCGYPDHDQETSKFCGVCSSSQFLRWYVFPFERWFLLTRGIIILNIISLFILLGVQFFPV